MERDELVRRLEGFEWTDVEFKEARRDVPKSAYDTVSAFANTQGGHLVFGVQQSGEDFEIVGVLSVDKVQGDFLTALRQRDKISAVLDVKPELHRLGESDLLVFYVPEAGRGEKPVYLNGDIRLSFVRKGGSDVRCSANERDRFLIDAMAQRFGDQEIECALDNAFDHDSIRWYRATYEARPGNRSHTGLSDLEFLDEMGFLVEREGTKKPNRAAILLFGNNSIFRQLLPRPVVDCQRFAFASAQADTGARWIDRAVLDENLIRTWRALVDWYGRFAEHPFRVDPASLQRDDTPPDYLAYREAMVNLLVHQDYSDHARKAEIRHYTDRTVFRNPGDAFSSAEDLIEPGEKELRNPRIVTAFRRIGLSENAGWGLRDIFRNWQQLGNVPPRINNDRSRKRFELVLLKEELLSERQRVFQASLGVHLTDEQARAFAFVRREGEVSLSQLRAVTGLYGPDAAAVAERLAAQRLIEPVGPGGRYALAEHLRERPGRPDSGADRADAPDSSSVIDQPDAPAPNLVTDQPDAPAPNLVTDQAHRPPPDLVTAQAEPLTELSETQRKIVALCDAPRSLTEIMAALGVTGRNYFKKRHLDPLIRAGVVAMTHPDRPNHPDQAYVRPDAGAPVPSPVTDQADAPAPNLVTHQAGRPQGNSVTAQAEPLTELSATHRKIVALCDVPRRLTEIMVALGVTGRNHFKKRHLEPLVRGGVLRMTHPDRPRHPDQAYVLTGAGAALKGRRAGGG